MDAGCDETRSARDCVRGASVAGGGDVAGESLSTMSE